MFEAEQIEEWRGADVYDVEGERIGKLDDLYEDRRTGRHVIGTVKTGLFGRKLSLVPLEGASVARNYMRLDVTKDQVKGAPQADSGGVLDDNVAGSVFGHYGRETPVAPLGDNSAGPRYEASAAREARESEARDKAERAAELEAQAERERERARSAEETAQSSDSAAADAASESERLRREAAELRGEEAPPPSEALPPPAATGPPARPDEPRSPTSPPQQG